MIARQFYELQILRWSTTFVFLVGGFAWLGFCYGDVTFVCLYLQRW